MNEHDLIQSVRSKVDIVDVISSYIPLVQKKERTILACAHFTMIPIRR